MDKTTHYGYNKPSELEYIDTDDYNENFDLIDGQIKELYDLKVDAVTNYNKLTNRPSIEGVMLTGDVVASKTFYTTNAKSRNWRHSKLCTSRSYWSCNDYNYVQTWTWR